MVCEQEDVFVGEYSRELTAHLTLPGIAHTDCGHSVINSISRSIVVDFSTALWVDWFSTSYARTVDFRQTLISDRCFFCLPSPEANDMRVGVRFEPQT